MTTFRSKAPRNRRRIWPWFAGAAGVALLLFGGLVLRARSFDLEAQPPLVASSGLPLTLPDGRAAKLGDLIRPGRPTVISLWASWCGPCRLEAPAIIQLRQRFGDRINLLYLNVRDETSSTEDLRNFLRGAGLSGIDFARLQTDNIAALTGASNNLVPRTLVYDRAGLPLAAITGYKPFALSRVAGLLQQ